MTTYLTTTDNPFSPKDEFEEWNTYDHMQGYNTIEYMGRIADISDDLPDNIQDSLAEDAIDEIVKINITGKYKKFIA